MSKREVEREVVEVVCLVIFPSISLKKDQVSSLNEKRIKFVVLEPESSDTEVKDAFEGLQSRFAVKGVLNTDCGFIAASWT